MERATVNPINGVFVFLDKVLFNWDKITNAASQNTGIETKYPIKLTANGRGSL